MTTNVTLTGPAWQAPLDCPAAERYLVTHSLDQAVEFAAVDAGTAAPSTTLRGNVA